MIKAGESNRSERDELLVRLRELCHDFDDEDDSAWLGEVAGCIRPLFGTVVLKMKRYVTLFEEDLEDEDQTSVQMIQMAPGPERHE